MATASGVRASRFFVILNPAAGSYETREVREALGRHLICADGSCDIHEATEHENLTEMARAAAERGCNVVVAGGGDGTVSAVANGLIGTSATLGILPLGTANLLAQDLGIPSNLEGACALLAGPYAVARIDALVPDGRHYYTRIGIGLDALTIRDTARKAKRRFGRLAYAWAAFTRLIGYQPGRFRISVDDRANHPRASQVVLANCGTMCRLPLRWGSGIRPDDGRVEVCIIRARNLIDYVVLAAEVLSGRQRSSRHMTYMVARRDVLVAADITLPVQADGDIIGETPIRVRIMTGDMPVIVPEGRNSP